jgi:hypothetical protein
LVCKKKNNWIERDLNFGREFYSLIKQLKRGGRDFKCTRKGDAMKGKG